MKRLRAARARNGERSNRWLNWPIAIRALIGLITWAALSLALLGYNLFPGRLSLKAGERSPVLIRAPRMAQYVDREETERLRREAAQRVSAQYSPLPFARTDAEKRVVQDFAALRASTPEEKEALTRRLNWLPRESVRWAAGASKEELSQLEEKVRALVREAMSKEIREGTADLRVAREEAAAAAVRGEPERVKAKLATAIINREISPTKRLDEEATKAARNEAEQRVQEVVRTIEADQPIVFAGERVTREHVTMLTALGLIGPRLDYRRLVSTLLIVGLIVLLLGLQTRHWAPTIYAQPKLLSLLALLAIVSLLVINLLVLALPNVWMLIVPSVALMAAVLLSDTLAMALALALSLLVGLMANAGLPATLLSLGSAVTALAFAAQLWPVSRLRVVVGAVAVVNVVLVIAVSLLQGAQTASIVKHALLAGALYAPGAAILALGGIYMLQRPFGITTHLGLLELSNPQVPLLKQLQTEAPGTYHHSMMVSGLAEAAAEAVGANALLTRVGALYHDIGKLNRPAFFVENQGLLGVENVHDKLSSSLSGLIIIAHVKDGVELARKHRLPPAVLNIIAEHHGATTMSYFYHQALTGSRPEDVSEEHFRYPGPLPTSKEAALVMLADGIHAAAKSISEPTPQRVQQMVREIVRERVVGGQLAQCELSFKEIAAAEVVLARVLTASLCRDRVAYPEPVQTG